MKKVFFSLSVLFSVVLASLFLFSSADFNFSLFLQKFMEKKESRVPLVLISHEENSFESAGFDSPQIKKILQYCVEFGAIDSFYEENSSLKKIDVTFPESQITTENEKSLFGIKIVFPTKKTSILDTKTPENPNEIHSAQNIHILFQKNGEYYALPILSKIIEIQKNPQIHIENSKIQIGNTEIPRNFDGSISLKFPAQSYRSYKTLSFSELSAFSQSEEKFHNYLKLIGTQGLFSELTSENPLDIFEKATSEKTSLQERKILKEQFYDAMKLFLSGKQEQTLLEQTYDEENQAAIKNSFSVCKTLFSELEQNRTELRDFLGGTFCIFATNSPFNTDFMYSPFDSHFPKNVLPFVISHMIFSEDFVNFLPPIFSVLIALFFCIIFALFAIKIKKTSSNLLFSLFSILITSALLIFIYLTFRIYVGFFIPVFSVVLISVFSSQRLFIENQKNWLSFNKTFSQAISEKSLKKIFSAPKEFILDGQKNEISILSIFIENIDELRSILNENQFSSIINHYFEGIFDSILACEGIVESYDTEKSIALFGTPLSDENHCQNAVASAQKIKEIESKINEEIKTYPDSPKIDGMSDDLYTAFFILNQNRKKMFTQTVIFTCEAATALLGAKNSFSYRIIDDSAKEMISLKKSIKNFGTQGILLNETAAEIVKNDFIIRKIEKLSENSELKENLSEILGEKKSDDEKLWNYAQYWNQASDLLKKGEKSKALAIFEKLSQARPNDKLAKYFIKSLNSVE